MQKFLKKMLVAVLAIAMVVTSITAVDITKVSAANGKVSSITVTNLPAKTLTLKKGKSKVLKVKVTTSGSASTAYTFKSSKPSVVKVTASGKNVKVTAKKKGTSNVTLTSVQDSKSVTIKVTVGTPVTKVQLNQTKATIAIGQKLTLKATVKKSGASNKKVVWTTSDSKKATVSKKGVVKALKKGTVTITATAADGSGKKATCKVTVKKPTTVSKMTIVEDEIISVKLSAKQVLTASDFVIKSKKNKDGKFNKTLKIMSIYTSDNKTYVVRLNDYITDGDYVQVSVKNLFGQSKAISKSGQYKYGVVSTDYETTITGTKGASLNSSLYFGGYGYGYNSIKCTGLPSGITSEVEDQYLCFKGTPKKADVTTATVTITDEYGNKTTKKVTFVIGSTDAISAYGETEYILMDSTNTANYSSYLTVCGGSGNYNASIVGSNYGLSVSGGTSVQLYGNITSTGTKKVKVKITDASDSSISKTVTVTIYVKKAITIKGYVKDASGQPVANAYVYAKNTNINEKYCKSATTYTAEDGSYTLCVVAGKYNIEAKYYYSGDSNYTFAMKTNQAIKKAKTGYNFKLKMHKITINSSDTSVVSSFTNWYDADGEIVGYGDYVYVPKGETVTYTAQGTTGAFATNYNATVTVKADKNKTVTAKVTKYSAVASKEFTGAGSVSVSVNGNTKVYYKFTPKTSKTYKFYSEGSYDTYGYLYDADGNLLTYNDDGGTGTNFSFTYSCTAGTTYYVAVKRFSGGESISTNLVIE